MLLKPPVATTCNSRLIHWLPLLKQFHTDEVVTTLMHIAVAHFHLSSLNQMILLTLPTDQVVRHEGFTNQSIVAEDEYATLLHKLSKSQKRDVKNWSEEFTWLFNQVMRLTQKLDRNTACIMAYEEAVMLLIHQTQNQYLQLWPTHLASGSAKFRMLVFTQEGSHSMNGITELQKMADKYPLISKLTMEEKPLSYYKFIINIIQQSANAPVGLENLQARCEIRHKATTKIETYHQPANMTATSTVDNTASTSAPAFTRQSRHTQDSFDYESSQEARNLALITTQHEEAQSQLNQLQIEWSIMREQGKSGTYNNTPVHYQCRMKKLENDIDMLQSLVIRLEKDRKLAEKAVNSQSTSQMSSARYPDESEGCLGSNYASKYEQSDSAYGYDTSESNRFDTNYDSDRKVKDRYYLLPEQKCPNFSQGTALQLRKKVHEEDDSWVTRADDSWVTHKEKVSQPQQESFLSYRKGVHQLQEMAESMEAERIARRQANQMHNKPQLVHTGPTSVASERLHRRQDSQQISNPYKKPQEMLQDVEEAKSSKQMEEYYVRIKKMEDGRVQLLTCNATVPTRIPVDETVHQQVANLYKGQPTTAIYEALPQIKELFSQQILDDAIKNARSEKYGTSSCNRT